ncbi:hypothetical protein BDV32DRAFT_120266 [Aspergillus pseudonomiae]|uniref:Azaphilone pigments biosynthesis cluster protein L N-terminal domain-containing protein n=1 Tax=Aspergillus pseudonomiae TaxID=1506151 RepID=A0A5N7D5X5_9EURO|nr:uncharacterized protein BDV37DRAFT_185970 [Aspergillus pseudonomiae]KAB8262538.1 hypothetical protein BDV32DRAFT_120266 [Aspergillus pseudonomiae]KAE8401198.1 hypothetical protein BDV37DRAFT_185970 [Aspergillus pseudonomiae]
MSGLEVIGVAASILQVVELGTHLSIKLYTFCRRLKDTDQRIQSLSSDVALTCNVLRQLGDSLQQDEDAKLYSIEAFATAQQVLGECRKVFQRISDAVDYPEQKATKGLLQKAARKVGFLCIEEDLEVLRVNLERLKSTMLLMLNVIMYAGQLRSRAESSVLEEQRELIRTLVGEKKTYEAQFERLSKALESAKVTDNQPNESQLPASLTMTFACDDAPLTNELLSSELREYDALVKKVLSEIDAYQSRIEYDQYRRMIDDILQCYYSEISHCEARHGQRVAPWFWEQYSMLCKEYAVTSSKFDQWAIRSRRTNVDYVASTSESGYEQGSVDRLRSRIHENINTKRKKQYIESAPFQQPSNPLGYVQQPVGAHEITAEIPPLPRPRFSESSRPMPRCATGSAAVEIYPKRPGSFPRGGYVKTRDTDDVEAFLMKWTTLIESEPDQ